MSQVYTTETTARKSFVRKTAEDYPVPSVSEILKTYHIGDYMWRQYEDGTGNRLAGSWQVQSPTDPSSLFIVMKDAENGWTVQSPAFRKHHGPNIIQAVQEYITRPVR
jgi:hypothetical protein